MKFNLDNLPQYTMITDGHTMYPSICDKLGIEHALCTFHSVLNVRKKPYKKINRNNKSIKTKNEKIESKKKDLTTLNEKYEPKVGRFKKNRYNTTEIT